MPMNKTTPLHSATKSAAARKNTDKAPKARSDALALLTEFSNQGFRKTSMVALASAIGMSRQTLYNRFQTKEMVLQWATSELVALLKLDAIGYLADTTRSTGMILWDTFCCYLCPLVKLLREGRHGDEFLGLSAGKKRLNPEHDKDPLAEFTAQISEFLIIRKVCNSPNSADELSFLLVMAAKGLMLTSESEATFRIEMATAISGAGLKVKVTDKALANQITQWSRA